METPIIFISLSLCFFFFLALTKFLHKLWWTPVRTRAFMESQGIKGPSYRFLYGNTKEINQMKEATMTKTMELSHDIFPRVLPRFYSWANLYGKIFLHWHGYTAELVIAEPELVKQLLSDRGESFPKQLTDKYVKKVTGDGIIAAEGEKWAKLRKLANHAFHGENLKNMVPAMVESVDEMLRRWKNYDDKEIEVGEEFRKLTSEVISRTAFGSNYLEGEKLFQMLKKLILIVGKRMRKFNIPGMSFRDRDDVEADKLERGIQELVAEIIKKRELSMVNKMNNLTTDYLGVLLKAHQDAAGRDKIIFQEIIDECKTFYAAGQDTAQTLLTWTVFLLALHTDWQDRARTEVLDLLGQQHPNSEDISKLKIMSMIINETLRLYPPVVVNGRKVKKDAKLGKFTLPEGMRVTVPVLALHHDPKIWGEDAHLFKPERFSKGVAEATNGNPSAFLPFSLGPRTCVGSNFAITEAKIAISMILQQYAFFLSPNYAHSPVQMINLKPQRGIQVLLHQIKQ